MDDQTLRELMKEVRDDVKEILQVQAAQAVTVKQNSDRLNVLEPIVRDTQTWRTRVTGMLVVIGVIGSVLATVVKDAIAAAWPWGH